MHVLRCVAAVLVAGAAAVGCSTPAVSCDCPASPPRGCVFTGRTGCACAAMVCSDVGPLLDIPVADVETRDVRGDTSSATDARVDAGAVDAQTDAPMVVDGVAFDGGPLDGGSFDAPVATDLGATADAALDVTADRGAEAGADGASDAGSAVDVPRDGGADAGSDTGVDAARDAGPADVPVTRPDSGVVGPDVPPPDSGMPLTCEPSLATPPPRVCAFNSDCVAGTFTLDCCGTLRAIAYNAATPTGTTLFNLLRATCDMAVGAATGHACGCPSRGIVLDNGMIVPLGSTPGSVCASGMCTTAVP